MWSIGLDVVDCGLWIRKFGLLAMFDVRTL